MGSGLNLILNTLESALWWNEEFVSIKLASEGYKPVKQEVQTKNIVPTFVFQTAFSRHRLP